MFPADMSPSMAPESPFAGWHLKKIRFTCVPNAHSELHSPGCDVLKYSYVVNIVHIWTYLDNKFWKTMLRSDVKAGQASRSGTIKLIISDCQSLRSTQCIIQLPKLGPINSTGTVLKYGNQIEGLLPKCSQQVRPQAWHQSHPLVDGIKKKFVSSHLRTQCTLRATLSWL